MSKRINLLETWDNPGGDGQPLELVRLGKDEQAVIPFMGDAIPVTLHYLDDPEIRGYQVCHKDPKEDGADRKEDCVLCLAGRKADARMLLPVYVPATRCIGVLPISPVSRPGSLRPQVMPLLRTGKRLVLLISKPDQTKFSVTANDLTESMDDGAKVIKAFTELWETGKVDLTSVFLHMDNRDLAAIPGVAAMLRAKGINPDDYS